MLYILFGIPWSRKGTRIQKRTVNSFFNILHEKTEDSLFMILPGKIKRQEKGGNMWTYMWTCLQGAGEHSNKRETTVEITAGWSIHLEYLHVVCALVCALRAPKKTTQHAWITIRCDKCRSVCNSDYCKPVTTRSTNRYEMYFFLIFSSLFSRWTKDSWKRQKSLCWPLKYTMFSHVRTASTRKLQEPPKAKQEHIWWNV